jgi:hypothetical protein
VDEIEYLNKKYKLSKFHFVDDTFTANRQRLFDFAKELKKRSKT